MGSKGHFWLSMVKSGIRIIAGGLCIATSNIYVLAIGFIGAELLGILEELFDER